MKAGEEEKVGNEKDLFGGDFGVELGRYEDCAGRVRRRVSSCIKPVLYLMSDVWLIPRQFVNEDMKARPPKS